MRSRDLARLKGNELVIISTRELGERLPEAPARFLAFDPNRYPAAFSVNIAILSSIGGPADVCWVTPACIHRVASDQEAAEWLAAGYRVV